MTEAPRLQIPADFGQVRRPQPLGRALLGWSLTAWATTVVLLLALGPFRNGAGTDLATRTRFLVECLAGAALTVMAAWGALALSVPGRASLARALGPAAALLLLWLGLATYALYAPALAPSMAGKRPHCFVEVLALSLPPLALLWALLRRRAALRRVWAGLLAGIAGAAIPAVSMQLACRYEPWHAWTYHLSPIALVALAAVLLAPRLLPRF